MSSPKHAITFPGQGAHNVKMLSNYVGMDEFNLHYEMVSAALGYSPLDVIEKDPEKVNSNALSTLLTVLTGKLAYLDYSQKGLPPADFLAGYSISQFTALHVAGCFDFEQLTSVLAKRALFMERCAKERPSSMAAIVGAPEAKVEEILGMMRDQGFEIWISNYNCAGQYSLAGDKKAIEEVLRRSADFNAKRLVELPVGGAWHCPLMKEAMTGIEELLAPLPWRSPCLPVINNVSGDFMPQSIDEIKAELVKQVSHPVRWDKGIKTLIAEGCTTFTEVGYGNVLTKFGFFIDRSLDFTAYSGEALAACVE